MNGERENGRPPKGPLQVTLSDVEQVLPAFRRWYFEGDTKQALLLRKAYDAQGAKRGSLLSYAEQESRHLGRVLPKDRFDETGYMVGMLGACVLLQAGVPKGKSLPDIHVALSQYQAMRQERRQHPNLLGSTEGERLGYEVTTYKVKMVHELRERRDEAIQFIRELPALNAAGKDSLWYGFAEGLHIYNLALQPTNIRTIDPRTNNRRAA